MQAGVWEINYAGDGAGGTEQPITAYEVDMNADQGGDRGDYDSEIDDLYDDRNPDDIYGGISFAQREQYSFGDPIFATTILGGKAGRLEKMALAQSVPKEALYIRNLQIELSKFFPSRTDIFIDVVKKVDRYWLKNPGAIVATIRMLDRLRAQGKELSGATLVTWEKETGISKGDLFRYYMLLKDLYASEVF